MTNRINSEQAVEHAWKYFELHSNQRITMFNYFLFIIAGLGTSIGVILQTSKNLSYVGIFLSILSIIVSIIFWKLDQRTSFLIKQSEAVFKRLERNSPIDIGIFCNEEANLEKNNIDKCFITKIVTYGLIFRTIFIITGMIGCLGVLIFLSIINGYMILK
ncbi:MULTISPECIES: hypothetical protein [Acinetobacter calcoaceticus/baumannii complex]|uniref:RipA family octameric membrane protein n=1 Tax=Acinetobacter calcoaceticus/baumannii complex TaxID=909768 RepID=UPI00083F68AA|nr:MULTISPECIES: hypothetical protein [Acinetobacter calcoaceticus/baumannii complex]MDH2518611.1 hypothetical protein [Acinetobacter baumannii]ODL98036.1 hypothetical protein AXH21_02930 [Acinetobacter pittii]